jgi:hypothetical protein
LVGPFQNPSLNLVCTTVTIDPGTCVNSGGNVLIHATAYTTFDPLNPSLTYMGDVGKPDDFDSFSFVTQPNGQFFVVGQQVLDIISPDQNGEGCQFSATVEFGEGACDP